MKSAFAVSLGLVVASAIAAIDTKGRPDRIQRRHVALRPRGDGYSGGGAPYAAGSYGSGSGAGAGAYGGGSGGDTSSAGWGETTSTAWASDAAAYTSSNWQAAQATTSAESASTTSAGWGYNSGSYGNNQGGYDSCVQQCQAQYEYGGGAMTYAATTGTDNTATATYNTAYATASAAPPAVNATGTPLIAGPNQVVVAPMKGDLRMVPFNINVKKGVTIEWVWGAGPHTVTKSSLTSICNATADAPFKSGMQNATFKFPVQIDTEETTSYFCGVPTHCQKGMFGLINGAVSTDPAKGYGSWMQGYAKQNPEFKQKWDSTQQACQGTPAESWGSMIDTSQLPEWAHPMAAEAILETRSFYAQNPKILAAQSGNATMDMGANSTSPSVDPSAAAGASDSASPSASVSAAGAESANGTSGMSLSGAATPSKSVSYTSGLALVLVALGSVLLA